MVVKLVPLLKPNRLGIFRNVSVQNFQEDYSLAHIETSRLQKTILTVGSSIVSLMDPSRGDMIATLGETTGHKALRHMRSQMNASQEGKTILKEMPRINSHTVDLEYLKNLPVTTLGNTYFKFLERNKVTPNSRLTVQFVDDIDLAYVMQRYREVHDLIHAILRMPTNMLGEVTVKWVEGIQTHLPMCIGGGLFGAIRLSPKQRQKYITTHLPWAIQTGMTSSFLLGVYFEKRWEQPLDELLEELKIIPINKLIQDNKG